MTETKDSYKDFIQSNAQAKSVKPALITCIVATIGKRVDMSNDNGGVSALIDQFGRCAEGEYLWLK